MKALVKFNNPTKNNMPGNLENPPKGRQDKRNVKLFMHPPSIPTRFQTFHFDDREAKAFNSTAPRFEQSMDELPGPGYYKKSTDSLEIDEPSISKKGYGVGFASKTSRFKKPPTDLETTIPVYPGQYNINHTPVYSNSLLNSKTSSFVSPIAVKNNKKFFTPGPGAYNTNLPSRVRQKYVDNNAPASFVFKSKTKRQEINCADACPGRDAPPPWAYQVKDVKKNTLLLGAAFKAPERKNNSDLPQNVPGPGAYDPIDEKNTFSDEKKTEKKSRKIMFTSIIQEHTRPTSSYPKPIPGPGRYELAMASENIQTKGPIAKSVFTSNSPRFPNYKPATKMGPGFYHPIPDLKFRTYHLNLDGLWA